jgi:hypothetical protein
MTREQLVTGNNAHLCLQHKHPRHVFGCWDPHSLAGMSASPAGPLADSHAPTAPARASTRKHLLTTVCCTHRPLQVYDCNHPGQQWYADTVGRLHPLHAPLLCLDIASSRTAVTTCSAATTQSWAGLGEYKVLPASLAEPLPVLEQLASCAGTFCMQALTMTLFGVCVLHLKLPLRMHDWPAPLVQKA